MTKKSVKDLDSELKQVKQECKDLQVMFSKLAEKYEVLEKKHEECGVGKKRNFDCTKCKKKFESKLELLRHKKTHKLAEEGTFKCDGCE